MSILGGLDDYILSYDNLGSWICHLQCIISSSPKSSAIWTPRPS